MLNEVEIKKDVEYIEKAVKEIVERMYEDIENGDYPLQSDAQQLYEFVLKLDAFDWVLNGDEILAKFN